MNYFSAWNALKKESFYNSSFLLLYHFANNKTFFEADVRTVVRCMLMSDNLIKFKIKYTNLLKRRQAHTLKNNSTQQRTSNSKSSVLSLYKS